MVKLVGERYLGGICLTSLAFLWWADHVTPVYFLPSGLYVVPVALTAIGRSSLLTYATTALSLVANVVEGYLDFRTNEFDIIGVGNRLAAVLALVLVAALVVSLQRAFLKLELRAEAIREESATMLEQAQELARVNRIMLMGQMMASIAHEITQPVTGMALNAATSLRYLLASDAESAQEYLELVVRDSRRATETIKRVRGMARRAPPAKTPVDLNEAILDVVALAQGVLDRHATKVELDLATDLPEILADRIQIQQVLLNLIVNAAEAMFGTGMRDGTVRIVSGRAQPGFVFVEVRDRGPGLSARDVEELFTPFYTTKADGIGLGLAISRLIVEAHGGQLSAFPSESVGSVFRLTILVA